MNNSYITFSKKTIWKIIFSVVIPAFTFAQNLSMEGGEFPLEKNTKENPCINAEQYKLIEKQYAGNLKMLGLENKGRKKNMSTLFSWPLQMANGLNDCSYYYIGAYVDQDTTSPGFKNWNCGTVTYDGHRGTDICSAPYPFYKMDNNQLQVIAAAPGTIVNKVDGNFDKNCAPNNSTANYIIVQHLDGSCALYWHMKKNSLTAKIVGQTVVAGEFLGVVGSSGSASGPHLHFEVWSGTTSNTLKDPYSGACNNLNANSWWITQKPYSEPAIIKAQVNTIAPVFPACPTTETPNEDSCFTSGATAKFYIFIRAETAGLTANMRIVNPGGSTFSSWTHNSVNTYSTISYYYANRVLPTAAGTYTFETTYNGITCSKIFTVSCGAMGIDQTANSNTQLTIYPNPANNNVKIYSGTELGLITLYNSLGEIIYSEKINSKECQIDLSIFSNGIYFLKARDRYLKLIKE
jgi:murein DD-endopeptidase MepM/ murein hydrolase activator NlpD